MTDDLRTRIWRLLETHGIGWIDNGTTDCHCYCGYRSQRLGESWHLHVADAVIANLGLRRENGELLHRWVTDWERPDYCTRCGIPHTTPCRREENR